MLFITGGTGFLGQTLLRHLFDDDPSGPGSRVALLVRDAAATKATMPAAWAARIVLVQGHLGDAATWRTQVDALPISGVLHLAAMVEHTHDPAKAAAMHALNVAATCDVVAMAAQRGVRCVFVSSSGTVGCSLDADHAPDELAPMAWATSGRWPYYRSKMEAELQARALAPDPAQLVIVRPPVMLGPGDERYRSTGTIVRVLKGPLPFSLAGGMACIDVRDVVGPLLQGLQHASPRPVYNLPGHALPLSNYFHAVAELAKRPAPKGVLPHVLAMAVAHASVVAAKLAPKRFAKPWLDPVLADMGRHHWRTVSLYSHAELGLQERPLVATLTDTIADLRARRADCRAS